MRYLVVLLVLFASIGSVGYADSIDDLQDRLIGTEGYQLSGILKSLFGNERINVVAGDLEFSVVSEDGRISGFNKELLDNPTLIVSTSEEVLQRIVESESPETELKNALDSGEITYEAYTLVGKIKYGIVNVLGRFL